MRAGFSARRLWLLLLALPVLLTPAETAAFGERTQFAFAVLDLDPSVRERSDALRTLSAHVRRRTSVQAAEAPRLIPLTAEALFRNPLVILPVCRRLPDVTEADAALLRRWLDLGGLLVFDNCQGRPGGEADRWIRDTVQRIHPGRPLQTLPADHSLYRSFYLLDRAYGRTAERSDLEGVSDGDRTAILVYPNDMLGALLRDPYGSPLFRIPERTREMTQRQGINLVMYALTLNYKKDQIHIPFILKRRQR